MLEPSQVYFTPRLAQTEQKNCFGTYKWWLRYWRHFEVTSFIIWLASWTGKMSRILRCDWLLERARWPYLACSGLPAVSRKKLFPESHMINLLLTKLLQSRSLFLCLYLNIFYLVISCTLGHVRWAPDTNPGQKPWYTFSWTMSPKDVKVFNLSKQFKFYILSEQHWKLYAFISSILLYHVYIPSLNSSVFSQYL